ncbi:DEHA2G22748p [Debaryomyces hansenii CBS767]|uniref:DEHA2G22748p n=1 Tax=Debaryomyces hansenii (strain ATCC 36239 / CBS 767 / BCRC 21394 / JCM 1990 / NBRC 0083 / IGC 2968) TaxID=284592 RepID=Q6BGY5_DEBHA|nr:DEHA2G22748p [Debaryomyces hansenii CBS767]CAG91046.1 DEHA2G22748p [Debaryomyces hansenii CBS767]|eukprot:XP_462536.1 DEHA2G22748p [Debaryomyces hansenii CBS767]
MQIMSCSYICRRLNSLYPSPDYVSGKKRHKESSDSSVKRRDFLSAKRLGKTPSPSSSAVKLHIITNLLV